MNSSFRQPSIGLRRAPSNQPVQTVPVVPHHQLPSAGARLPVLDETAALTQQPTATTTASTDENSSQRGRMGPIAKIKSKLGFGDDGQRDAIGQAVGRPRANTAPQGREYTASMVDVLDTLDAEVQTITSLTNVQNSLFIPNLGRWVNRQPTYVLRQSPSERESLEEINRIIQNAEAQEQKEPEPEPGLRRMASHGTLATIDSQLSDSRFAVLPQGTSLEGWTKEEKAELNDHVRHMLHSKRSKFKRAMRGFGQYVRRPLGFLVTLYATLITLFGLAWVLFLIGWINVGGKQIYVVHVIDSVLVALFAIVGDGLAPFRAVDTYHMIYIAHYHMYTWDRRKKDQLPKLHDHNDLPSSNAPISGPVDKPWDPEAQWEFTVLTPKQQEKLEHHQAKFCKSHSFYKPHETETHYAFPLRLLIAIVVLLDCHSLLQISLGACTWGIYYKNRHFAITTVILICSITCNATAGLLILIGDRRTRKKDVLERMNRQELTEEAMHKIQKKRDQGSESEDNDEKEGAKSRKSTDVRRSVDVFRKSLGGREREKEKDALSQTKVSHEQDSPPPVPPKDNAAYP